MGNGSSSNRRRHHHRNHQPSQSLPPPPPQPPSNPEMTGNRYVFAAATPYPSHYPNPNPNPNPNYYQYSGYYPPPPPQPPSVLVPPPTSFDHQRGVVGPNVDPGHVNWVGGRFPCLVPHVPPPYVEHQKAVTIRNDVNIKKETLKMEPDEVNPGFFLTTFIFDATVAGRITLIFFAKEGEDCNLAPVKDGMLQPITVSFQQGLGQRFKQPSGTGIDFSKFEEAELLKKGTTEIYPLVVKAEGFTSDHNQSEGGNSTTENGTSQITQAVFGKENGEYQVRVVKQILWVNGMRYELQEIYGIGNSSDTDFDGNDPGKECVICLSEPRDTTVLPCRHMCMCSECAKVLRFQTDRCPICRQPVERLLEIKVNDRQEE